MSGAAAGRLRLGRLTAEHPSAVVVSSLAEALATVPDGVMLTGPDGWC
ncbi:hypothetical protein HTZ77_09945 [Nonomuraea sp. SMC257]|uniref:Uncharacterized protein n=1 Tax=Nonomuraea montanisoli TaxID=2741721 RepID=A0A7Y6I4U9_9ACTN|nr:hypothetical protein [Nonomuraea montanisoli]NUW31747.1 hypothetical protein [Nonomuraea montanisoli]